MPSLKTQKYAQINHYSGLIVPVDLLPMILERCYLIDTSWDGNKSVITGVNEIKEFSVRDVEEVRSALVQQALSKP
jgi:hypothetical protein